MKFYPGSDTETQASNSERTVMSHSFNSSRKMEENDMGSLKE